ncbi:MAG: type II toxin-antitoxin system HigB family toxin [Pseudomonadota bacterium]
MRVIAKSTLRAFWEERPDAEQPLRTWHAMACKADWKTPADVKADYRNASIIANNRVVFNIKGNDYRLITAINYDFGTIWIKFIGTHAEYDRIDAATVG